MANAIGTPAKAAMASIRIDPHQAVVHLKHDPYRTLPAALTETHTTPGTVLWTAVKAELSNSGPSQIDWLVTICPLALAPMGWADRAEKEWDQDMTALVNSLASIRGLRDFAFIVPHSWNTTARTLSKTGTGQASWMIHHTTL